MTAADLVGPVAARFRAVCQAMGDGGFSLAQLGEAHALARALHAGRTARAAEFAARLGVDLEALQGGASGARQVELFGTGGGS